MTMFHYTACGLPNVFLENGYEVKPSPMGDGEAFTIMHIKDLHMAIGLALVGKPSVLTGDEFRFLRTELGMSRNSLAGILGVSFETIKKWETDGDSKINNKLADIALRAIYEKAADKDDTFVELINQINDTDNRKIRDLRFKETAKGWVEAA